MRKKSLLLGKKLLSGFLAVSMVLGLTAAPERKIYAAEPEDGLVYFVDCGDFNPQTVPEGEKLGSDQSVTDKIYGEDSTGKSWGVITSDTDQDIGVPSEAQKGSNAVYTTYQWANETQNADGSKIDTFRYAHGQDTAGIQTRYVRYQFEVEPGEYQVTVGMGNTWGNAGNPDVYAGITGEKETDVKLNEEALNIPQNSHKEAVSTIQVEEGISSLYVYALSQDATLQMNYIQIVKIPENVVTTLNITTQPDKTEYFVGEEFDAQGMSLEVVYRDGTTKAVDISNCILKGFDSSKPGEKNVTVSYTEGITVQASFSVIIKKVPITISQDPNLTYFVDCGDFDPETTFQGDAISKNQSVTDRVYGEDSTGKSWGVVTSDSDLAIGIPTSAQQGSNAAYTTYQWANERQTEDNAKEDSFRYAKDQGQAGIDPRYVKYQFEVESGEYQVIVGMGNTWGNAANPDVYAGASGAKETDIKLNAETLNIPENGHAEVVGTVQVEEGMSNLYVYALSEEATIQMNYIQIRQVPKNPVTALNITGQPAKTEYFVGDELDTEGLRLEVVYKDGTTKAVDASECVLTGFDSSRPGQKSVTISYTEGVTIQTSFQVLIKKLPITISENPDLVYFVDCGDFDPETTSEGDAVGKNQSVTDRVYGEDSTGKKWGVVVSDTDQAINIPSDAQTGSNAAYTTYQWANERQTYDTPKEDSFRYAKDQGQAGIDPRYIKYQFDMEPGTYQIIVGMGNTWGNATNPDIYAGTAGGEESDIKLNKEALNIPENGHAQVTGIVQVEDGASSLYVYALSEDETIQMNEIQITKTTTTDNKAESLEIAAEPAKKEYYVGEKLDLTGLLLHVIYQDGTKKAVNSNECTLTGFDSSKAGSQTLTIAYTDETGVVLRAEFTIDIVKPVPIKKIIGLELLSKPNKTEYQLSETYYLDTKGLRVAAVYSDDTKKELQLNDYEITGFVGFFPGTQTITITYTENRITVQTEFEVKVVQKEVVVIPESLQVVSPSKTEYYVGESLNLDGMELIVRYSDRTEKKVEPAQCKITGFDSSEEGTKTVSVAYTEKDTTVAGMFEVKIVKRVTVPKTYKVYYHENKGGKVSGMPSDETVYKSGEIASVKGKPVSTTKFFAGWNTRADGKGVSYTAGKKITIKDNIHLYAQWKTSYTASNKLKYKVTGKQTVACGGTTNKKATSIKVPATIKYQGISYKVTSIGTKAFANNSKIKKVVVGNNVKTIGARAFQKCKNLKNITIGTGLTVIEKYAFSAEKKGCVLTINSKRLNTVKTAINHKTKNMVVKVPKSKLKAYKKLFAKKAKNLKVIAK